MTLKKHLLLLGIGFPPAAKSSAYRLREMANQFAALGWDVTALTIADESWEREYGLDYSLLDAVDPRVRIVKVPIARADLETDIRTFSRERAIEPKSWIAKQADRDQRVFPEPVFGGWLPALQTAALKIHSERPADLVLASCAPYVLLGVAKRLWDEHKVPYSIDLRDGWSLDVISGQPAFVPDSRQGLIEADVLSNSLLTWCVNDAIADFYRDRYPAFADRIRVARNGFDIESVPASLREPDPENGLDFGYLGSVNFRSSFLATILGAWHDAREKDDLMARSRFEIRGHIGMGHAREANAHVNVINRAAQDGVIFGGSVANSDVAATYARWDALVLMLVGGKYVTSGKVYEFAASGLPILSAHEAEHDASEVLKDRPMWSGPVGNEREALTEAFINVGRITVSATLAQRTQAREQAQRFERSAPIARMARELVDRVSAGSANNPEESA